MTGICMSIRIRSVGPGRRARRLLAVRGQVDGEIEIGQHVHGDLLVEWLSSTSSTWAPAS